MLPEQIREEFGIDKGDEVVVDIKAVLKTAERRVDVERLRESLRAHVEKLSGIPTRREPRPGELARTPSKRSSSESLHKLAAPHISQHGG